MTSELKQDTMKTETINIRPLLIDYITSFQGEAGYPESVLHGLPDDNIIAIAQRVYAERQLEKSKPQEDEPCGMCGQMNCEYC